MLFKSVRYAHRKKNEYKNAQIIERLINGVTKITMIQSKKYTPNIRLKRGRRIALDKLLI
jgi:hypothetical protein